MKFLDRADAGRQLAHALRARDTRNTIVMGLTRGGVAVAAELAHELAAPLEICVARKLLTRDGVAFGCVAEAGGLYLDLARVAALGLHSQDVNEVVQREAANVVALSALYRDRPALLVGGRDVILVDDGLTSIAAVRAAAHSLRRRHARTIVLAVPVANAHSVDELRPEVDRVVCLDSDELLATVGARYCEFSAVSEAEVVDLLVASRRGGGSARTRAARSVR